MLKKILALSFLFFLLLGLLCTSAQEPLCKQIANYTMSVTLDTKKNLIKASEILSWTNDSENSIDELWFHLYWNAFQNNMSTFLTEASRRGRRVTGFTKDDWGYCQVNSIKIINNPYFEAYDLFPDMEFDQPDDENLYEFMFFEDDDQNPFEFICLFEMMISILIAISHVFRYHKIYKDSLHTKIVKKASKCDYKEDVKRASQ